LVLLLAVLLRLTRDRQQPAAEMNHTLHEATLRLAQINMQLQEYAVVAEQEAILSERKRLAREIHDTIAYTLTNLVMMMEAAIDLAGDQVENQRQLLVRAREQAKEGLGEVRQTLQALRPEKLAGTTGLPAIKQLVDTFAKATQINVELNFGDVPLFFGDEADWTAYRVVQEGITNALRHGRAAKIWISFSRIYGGVSIFIRDEGPPL
jgi:signal transduction histidine kinase